MRVREVGVLNLGLQERFLFTVSGLSRAWGLSDQKMLLAFPSRGGKLTPEWS